MFTDLDFKIAFGLTIISSIVATKLILVNNSTPKSNILGNLSLKVKKLVTLTGDVKVIVKIQASFKYEMNFYPRSAT